MNALRIGLLGVFATLAAVSVAAPAPVHELSRAEFEALLARPAEVLIIDLRQPDEVTNVGGFPVYLSVQAADLERQIAWIPQGRTIVTVSNHKGRSGKAAALLIANGFKVAGSLGAKTFEEQGGKLTRIAPRAPATAAAAAPAPARTN